MNSDGFASINLTVPLGAKIPMLRRVGGMMLARGAIAPAVGDVII